MKLMARKKIIAIAVAVLGLITAVICAVYISYDRVTEKINVDLYFINEGGTGIVSSPCKVRYKNDDDLIINTLEMLKDGPKTAKLGAIMQKGTEINGIELLGGGFLTVHFSDDFLTDDPSRNVLNVYAVVKSLCSTAHVSSVRVLVNGETIKDRDQKSLEYISASDINLETEEYRSEMRKVKLYFADSSGEKLVGQTRTIKITDQQPIEQYIINELIKGAKDKKMKSLLSKETVLVSVDVEENICYLNFKSNFLTDNKGNEQHEKLVIYSIVNSLTELQTIARVQFYMDGKRVSNFGNVRIKDYIERNTAIINREG